MLDSPTGTALRIFTAGDDTVSPFRFNPLEVLPGVLVSSHIAAVQQCIEASVPTFGAMPAVIGDALQAAYVRRGWSLSDRARRGDSRPMPTLGDLYAETVQVIERRGYKDPVRSNVLGAATGRIGALLKGGIGRMLNTQQSIPFDELMRAPTVIELDLLSDNERSLVMLFLLTTLREYCRTTRETATLQHVTLIEEAHRVMGATPHVADRETSADSRAAAVDLFSSALSEWRKYGEGIIVAEQDPGRLVADALNNTNVKVIHRLPDERVRRIVGGTMRLAPEQEDAIAGLKRGEAAVFAETLSRPTFITVTDYRGRYRGRHNLSPRVRDERVAGHMATSRDAHPDAFSAFPGCSHCHERCRHRDRVELIAYDVSTMEGFARLDSARMRARTREEQWRAWQGLVQGCVASTVGTPGGEHAAYCLFTHLCGDAPTEDMANVFRQTAREQTNGAQ
jgi:hypothetical protein